MNQHTHRRIQTHYIDRQPRISLDHTKHASIDTVLKDLKFCARRLQTSLKAQLDEAQILERLYYKGKNQHRGALFWRRVVEMRRFCNRIDGMHIDVVVDDFHYSFFDESLRNGSKLPKGPWTHFPDAAFVDFALARLSACSELLKKMDSRLMDAYRSFTLTMQSGAFLQLILTLVAIASRMGTLSSELQEALEATSIVARKISFVLASPGVELPTSVVNERVPSPSELPGTAYLDLLNHGNPLLSTASAEQPIPVEMEIAMASEGPQLASRVVIERKVPRQAPGDIEPNKKRRKKQETGAKDEIDKIFGF